MNFPQGDITYMFTFNHRTACDCGLAPQRERIHTLFGEAIVRDVLLDLVDLSEQSDITYYSANLVSSEKCPCSS